MTVWPLVVVVVLVLVRVLVLVVLVVGVVAVVSVLPGCVAAWLRDRLIAWRFGALAAWLRVAASQVFVGSHGASA